MRKIILLAVVLLQAVTLFSQVSKEDYLKKSKKQKSMGNIFLAGGGALVIAAFLYPRGDYEENITLYYAKKTYPNDNIKIGIAVAGAAAMLGSIPFYISAAKNRKKAEAVSINLHNQKIMLPHDGNLIAKIQPGVRFRVPL